MERRRLCRDCGGSGVIEWGMFCRPCKGKGYFVVEADSTPLPTPPKPEDVLNAQQLINLANWSASHKLDRLAEEGLDHKRLAFARYLVSSGRLGEDE